MTIFQLVRPALFLLSPERAHQITVNALKMLPVVPLPVLDAGLLSSRVAGLTFLNPVGLAAGFDKDAVVPQQTLGLGFGFVEVGTLTPRPQSGNPQPRLFRLTEDQAVINRMGFNNGGQIEAYPRLRAARMKRPGVIGVNIGANKDSVDRISDYAAGAARMAALASYITINISSPNTPGLRALQDEAALSDLIEVVRASVPIDGPPLFLKLAPDLERSDIDGIVRLAMGKMDALIVSNTTLSRPALRSANAHESGGLSGVPLRDLAQSKLKDFRSATGGQIPLIGVGGISTAADAYARIRAGASLIQIYSALVYEGPGLARRINKGLIALLQRDGFTNISQAVGVDAS
jgi:dihydroorotate dehydrogenase